MAWEYLVAGVEPAGSGEQTLERRLDDYGDYGWELTSVIPIPGPLEHKRYFALLVFKRPRPTAPEPSEVQGLGIASTF